jgi:hypothetical protein
MAVEAKVGFNADWIICPKTSMSPVTPAVAALTSMLLLADKLGVTKGARATDKQLSCQRGNPA